MDKYKHSWSDKCKKNARRLNLVEMAILFNVNVQLLPSFSQLPSLPYWIIIFSIYPFDMVLDIEWQKGLLL